MSIERKGLIRFRDQEVTVVGPDIHVDDQAPEFIVQNAEWKAVKALESTQGKVRIIGSLPSLSTSVCDRETRRFNEEAAVLGEKVEIMMVSMDLPYTLKNWCAAAGVNNVRTFSDHMEADFGQKYGVLLKEQRIFRRAIFVVDRQGRVLYAEYMPAIGDEPNYEAVLETARRAIASG